MLYVQRLCVGCSLLFCVWLRVVLLFSVAFGSVCSLPFIIARCVLFLRPCRIVTAFQFRQESLPHHGREIDYSCCMPDERYCLLCLESTCLAAGAWLCSCETTINQQRDTAHTPMQKWYDHATVELMSYKETMVELHYLQLEHQTMQLLELSTHLVQWVCTEWYLLGVPLTPSSQCKIPHSLLLCKPLVETLCFKWRCDCYCVDDILHRNSLRFCV
jgi:hypothetical protein